MYVITVHSLHKPMFAKVMLKYDAVYVAFLNISYRISGICLQTTFLFVRVCLI